jgi:hypothetical protein
MISVLVLPLLAMSVAGRSERSDASPPTTAFDELEGL